MKTNNVFKNTVLLIILFGGTVFFSCKHDIQENKPCEDIPDSVSFQSHMLPLFRSHCSTAGCHAGSTPAGNLNLEDSIAYDQLKQPGKGYVNLAKPEFSILYTQMNSVSQPMPPTGKLDDCKIEMVLRWIQQGARNN